MFSFHEKRKIRSFFYSKATIGVLFFLAIWMSFSVYDRYIVSREMKEKLVERQHELQQLEERAGALEAKVNHLKDERGIEEELRNRFDVAKEGEKVIIIVNEKENESVVTENKTTHTEIDSQIEEKSFTTFLRFWE